MSFKSLYTVLFVLSTGCTSLALKRQSVAQIESTTDLRYQEVLDNLALLKHSPYSLPAYSVILAGTTKVLDQGQLISATNIGREAVGKAGGTITHFQSETLDIPAQRAINENWTLDPVTSPEKLMAMRMACWWVLCGPQSVVENDKIHLGAKPTDDAALDDTSKWGYYFDVAKDLEALPPNWLHCGQLCDVPHNAMYKARNHNDWVWVTADGLEGLTQFTLILQNLSRPNNRFGLLPSANHANYYIHQERRQSEDGYIYILC